MRLRLVSKWCALTSIALVAGTAQLVLAQHEQHHPAEPSKDTVTSTPRKATEAKPAKTTKVMDQPTSAIVPGVPHEREGSGTSWLPDHSTVHALHWQRDPWMLMLHGVASLRYAHQDASGAGPRGGDAFSAPNWAMLMAARPTGQNSQLTLRAMLSLDRLTEGGDGYPLLFQTGESWEGQPLLDRQHPHDLFMELSAAYGHATGDHEGVFVYFGLPGEPALGPPAFMHRPSARNNPEAPLGHHWQDATHISFGVLTGGFVNRSIKLDASVFSGREPDEDRWDIDEPKFDSYAGRVSYNPSPRFSFQVSAGQLESPELLEPDIDLTRVTASALCHHPLRGGRLWTFAAIWGINDPSAGDTQHSFLVESDWEGRVLSPYGRIEVVQKSGHELQIGGLEDELFDVGALTLGLAAAIPALKHWETSAALQGTIYRVPEDIQGEYGENPWSIGVHVRLSPTGAMAHDASAH